MRHTMDINPQNVNILDGSTTDLVAECNQYEEKIQAVGGVELFLGALATTVPSRSTSLGPRSRHVHASVPDVY
jgi:hypothetical protein